MHGANCKQLSATDGVKSVHYAQRTFTVVTNSVSEKNWCITVVFAGKAGAYQSGAN